MTRRLLLAALFALALALGIASSGRAQNGGVHTFDGRHSIEKIAVRAVYFVPKDRTPLPDWRARADYFARRLEAFHKREFGGRSQLTVTVAPQPLRSPHTADAMRGGDQNAIYWRTVGEVWDGIGWPRTGSGAVWDTVTRPAGTPADTFPILLILSDINWRELDDFRRERIVDGVATHEGHIARDGRHFPGAESGGARAVYLPGPGVGAGLVSADGWRVPYSGSDCVVYHEGVGHTIGLPHPEPMTDSVMGTAQYRFWLNQTWIDPEQKRKLGLTDAESARRPASPTDLFSAFTALPEPLVPAPGQRVALRFTWPTSAKITSLTVETQTDLRGPWKKRTLLVGAPPATALLDIFPAPTPVSYRVSVTLADGQRTELWGYFQVKKEK